MNKIYKDSKGHYRTYSLFLETAHNTKEEPIYTLREEDQVVDGKLYVSAKRIYLECEDPTGYKAAIKLVGCWDAWERLLASSFFKKCVDKWNAELKVKLKSKAIQALVETALEGGVKGQVAAKYLAEYGWEKTSNGRGRPRKRVDEKPSATDKELEDDLWMIRNLEDNKDG